MKSAWQGWASRGSGVHTGGKGGSSWRGGAQKRKKLEACFCSVLGWGCEPCQQGEGGSGR